MSKNTMVTVNQSMFGFLAGEYYPAEKVTGGWKVQNEDGEGIVLPEHIVSAQMKPMSQVVEENTPPLPKPKKKVSSVEKEALEEALKQNPSQKESKGSILQSILSGEKEAAPAMTPSKLVKIGQEDEMKRKRERLRGPATPLLKEYQCWLSDLTDGVLPTSGVDHIITAYPDNYWSEQLQKDIPEFDIYHEWDADVLENLFLAHAEGIKNLAVGYPGTGKSTSGRNFAGLIRQPFMSLNGKDGIDASSFIGFLWANANGTEFAEGLLPVAMRNGYYMVIDEVFKIPPDIQMNFQTVYEEQGFLLLDEKPGTLSDKLVKPHPDFRLMGTDNAKGTGDNFEKFGSTQTQDTSTLDRFGSTVNVPYMPQDKEVQCLARLYPDVEEESIERLVRIANLVREGYGNSDLALTLSMRGLKVMCRFILRGLSEVSAFKSVYHSKLADQTEIDTCEQYIRTVGLSADLPVKSPVQAAKFTGSAKEYVDQKDTGRRHLPWESDNSPF